MKNSILFFNRCFDKKRLKNFILWFFNKYGERETIKLIEKLKTIGFHYVTKSGNSISIDDLKIPFIKSDCINVTESKISAIETNYQKGELTEIERQQQLVDEWTFVSERLKNYVVQFFKATNIFNPVYMMAFSGARGNISQIRQLIGMRGLMADPQGQILEFPIRSSFKEGLTLTEYLVSCYGARKGVVDTALRTATSGYLTRRLVDVAQQVVVGRQNCQTSRGIRFQNLMDGNKVLLSLKERLIGRILLQDIININPGTKKKYKVYCKNQEISYQVSNKIYYINNSILLRSPLTCRSKNSICQLCYGWNLAYNAVVSIGEAVGVLAAQSIGEPGTQLTMRTFHTGGVFTGGFLDQIYAPFYGKISYSNYFKGVLIRTLRGRIGFLTKTEGYLKVKKTLILQKLPFGINFETRIKKLHFSQQFKSDKTTQSHIQRLRRKLHSLEIKFKKIRNISYPNLIVNIPLHTILFKRHNELVLEKDLIVELTSSSLFGNRSQEVEQDTFSPTAGQVFFENLTLMEKTNRDGLSQKITYGLGSLWIINAIKLNPPIQSSLIPYHGDLMNADSIIQKFQILTEKSYFFDKKLLKLQRRFKDFKFRCFSIEKLNQPSTNYTQIQSFSLSKLFGFIQFQKINYHNFRYFVSLNFRTFFFTLKRQKKINYFFFLPNQHKFRKKNQVQQNLEKVILGLNFGFSHSSAIFNNRRPHSKPILSLYRISSNYNEGNIFLKTGFLSKINLKNKKFISSRTSCDFQILKSRNYYYQFWVKYDLKDLKTAKVWLSPWRNYLKLSSIKYKNLNNCQINQFLIFKNFIKSQIYSKLNFKIASFLDKKKYNQFSTVPNYFISVNRQSVINIKLLIAWSLQRSFRSTFFEKKQLNFLRVLKLTIFKEFDCFTICANTKIAYRTKSLPHPVLINPILIKNFFDQKNFLKLYIIRHCFRSFYYDYFINLKFDNYNSDIKFLKLVQIGFKTQFRINIFPVFIKYTFYDAKSLQKLKKIIVKNKKSQFLKQASLLNLNYKIKQNFKNWACVYNIENIINTFSSSINLGFGFTRKIYFNLQRVLNDVLCYKYLFKQQINKSFFYKHFINQKQRFSIYFSFSGQLILFQKLKEDIELKSNYALKLLNKNLNQSSFQNSLIFNALISYFYSFKKLSLKTKKAYTFFYFKNFLIKSNEKNYRKAETLKNQQLQIKFVPDLKIEIFLKLYTELTQKNETGFNFTNNLLSQLNKAGNFNPFFSKTFHFSTIKKLNFNKIAPNQVQKRFQILYKNFFLKTVRNIISVEFFLTSPSGEVIYTKFENRQIKINSIILTHLNLKTILFKNIFNLVNHKLIKIGEFIRYSTIFSKNQAINLNGQIIYIDKKKITIRKATPFLLTSKSILNVSQNEAVEKGFRLFTFLSNRLKTGDIIQGIPKIEEFFEARITREGIPLITNLHFQLKQLFNNFKLNLSTFEATQRSFEQIQYIIINEIQKVYCSQGIYISDKHLEIIVRQMTSKVQVLKGGQTGLLCGELIELDWIHLIEIKFNPGEILYEPIILGITKSCLETDSFIAAASFQETTRILTKAAIQNKIDFIRGLKQNVILGNLIPAGTGFFAPLYFQGPKSKLNTGKK